MFSKISWTNYWMFILLTLTVYYTAIILLYYLNEIKQVFSGKSSLFVKFKSAQSPAVKNALEPIDNSFNNENSMQDSESRLQSLVDDCRNDIKKLLEYAAENNLVKQEIMYALQQMLTKYPLIRNTSSKSLITNYIFIECSNYCSIHLDEGDLTGIWASE